MEHHHIGRVAGGGGKRKLSEQIVPTQRGRLDDQAVLVVHIEAVEDGVQHLGIVRAGPAMHQRHWRTVLRQCHARQYQQRNQW